MDGKDIMLNDVLTDPGLFDDTTPEQVEQIQETPPVEDGQAIDTGLQETEAAQGDNTVEGATAQTEPIVSTTDDDNAEQGGQDVAAGAQQPTDPNQALLMQMIAGQQQQINMLQQSLSQQSQTQEQAIMEQMQQPQAPTAPPSLDFNELLYADDGTREEKQQEWVNSMTEFVKQTALKDIEPMMNDYKATKESQAYTEAAMQLKGVPGIGDKLGTAIDGAQDVVNQIPALRQLDPTDALVLGALVAKGKEALNAPSPQEKTPEALAQEVIANPQVMKLIAAHNAEQLRQNANAPQLAAGNGGMSPAPINVQKQPQTIEEGLKFFDELI